MSVDFHIPKRRSVAIADLRKRWLELCREILNFLPSPALEIYATWNNPTDAVAPLMDDAALLGVTTGWYRVDLVNITQAYVSYLGLDAGISREVYGVRLGVGQLALNTAWSILGAEAMCELGGSEIEDEGFISSGGGPLHCGDLLQCLKMTRRGQEILRLAEVEYKRALPQQRLTG